MKWYEPKVYNDNYDEYMQFAELREKGTCKPDIKRTLRINEKRYLTHDHRYKRIAKDNGIVVKVAPRHDAETMAEYMAFLELWKQAPYATTGSKIGRAKSRRWIQEQMGDHNDNNYFRLLRWCKDNGYIPILDK